MINLIQWFVALAIVVSSSVVALAQDTIAYETGYITLSSLDADEPKPGILFPIDEYARRVHQINIVGELGEEGSIMLDGNTCSLNPFGEPVTCTEKFYRPVKVALPKVFEDQDWALYSINPQAVHFPKYALRLAINKNDPAKANLLFTSHMAPDIVLHVLSLRQFSNPVKVATFQATTHTIEIKDFKFGEDGVLEINAGDSVVWLNKDDVKHNAERDKEPTKFKTKLLAKNEKSKPVPFPQKGEFDYFCTPHSSFMKGKIIVK